MDVRSQNFPENAREALGDAQLQQALKMVRTGFIDKRAQARSRLAEFDSLRDEARDIKNHVLEHLDLYLSRYEEKVKESGGHVHWASTAEDARQIIADICAGAGAKKVTKGKSMVSEEIALNDHLESEGLEVVETDLGEYIIQIRNEGPSHIIAPAVHLTKKQVEADFRRVHDDLPADRNLDDPSVLVGEARAKLREQFLSADVGITGANMLVAETGSSIIVTNEGNGDLTQILPRVHVVIASLEKIVPTLEDASTILRVLARSATGQEFTTYTTFSTGPRRIDDPDGPEEYHVVLLDNGRTEMLGSEFQDMLRCIRCGACMNHCPVYHAVGGHAYGWVYPGPMGAVLTPSLAGIDETAHLPHASTFCGRCESVCPMRIPLPKMMRAWRERSFAKGQLSLMQKFGLGAWGWTAKRPTLYRLIAKMGIAVLGRIGRTKGAFSSLPLAGGWTSKRDLPAPQGETFVATWNRENRSCKACA